MKSKHKNTHSYEWYVYKDDSDVCPECGNKPRDYHVPSSHIALTPPVIFECANGHKWTEATIKIKSYEDEYGVTGEPEPDEWDFDHAITCPRCNENAFHYDNVSQDLDGQYSVWWLCDNCDYLETL